MIFFRYLCVTTILFLLSCTNERSIIPISEKSQSIYHTAVPGDTLYAIAWRYDVDFRSLADSNRLNPPYVIRAGQRIYLNAKKAALDSVTTTQNKVNTPKQTQLSNSKHNQLILSIGSVRWRWPSSGKLLSRFDLQKGLNKGIDIEGELGQPITASATGTVVYAGSGLLGYGQLIILKHDEQYLSAYGHNSRLLVKENDRVTMGQKIAEMGATGTNRIKLHFEIRKEGKPVDPLGYLPAR